MSIGFYFKGFETTEEFETYANASLSRVMDLAPYGATVAAQVECNGDEYQSHIEVFSRWGPFIASVRAPNAKAAIDKSLEKIQEKLQPSKAKDPLLAQ